MVQTPAIEDQWHDMPQELEANTCERMFFCH